MEIHSQEECRRMNGRVVDYHICAGGGADDACSGDSGGPLMVFNKADESWYQIGIVTSGPIPCAKPGVGGNYVNVAHFLCWIDKFVNKFN